MTLVQGWVQVLVLVLITQFNVLVLGIKNLLCLYLGSDLHYPLYINTHGRHTRADKDPVQSEHLERNENYEDDTKRLNFTGTDLIRNDRRFSNKILR